jgi:hypothetical protein
MKILVGWLGHETLRKTILKPAQLPTLYTKSILARLMQKWVN